MSEDAVIKELHEAKDELASKYGFSVEALGRALIRKQKARPRVRKPPLLKRAAE